MAVVAAKLRKRLGFSRAQGPVEERPETRFSADYTWIDYDRNGLLDLFVAGYVDFDLAHAPLPSLTVPNRNPEGVVYCGPRGLGAPQHYLYRNNGDGTFTDVSKESGIAALRGSYGLTAVATDVDEDGWPDIFLACHSTPSLLLMNNRDGTFGEEGSAARDCRRSGWTEPWRDGGAGDFDRDSHIDYVKTLFRTSRTGFIKTTARATSRM